MERMYQRDGYLPSHKQIFPKPGYPNQFMSRMMFPSDGPALVTQRNGDQLINSHQNMINSRMKNAHFTPGAQNSESGFNNQVEYFKGYNHNHFGHQQRPMSTPRKSSSNDVHKMIAKQLTSTEPDTSSKTVTFSESTLHSGSSEGASTGYTADCSSNTSGKDGSTLASGSTTGDTSTDEKHSNAGSNNKTILSLTKLHPKHRISKFRQVAKYICATLFLGLLAVMAFGIYASVTGFLDAEKTPEGNKTLDIS